MATLEPDLLPFHHLMELTIPFPMNLPAYYTTARRVRPPTPPSPSPPPPPSRAWCTIAYNELTNSVGPLYEAFARKVAIDGYLDPEPPNDRICLGAFPNFERDYIIDKVRREIGLGIVLEYNNGQVTVHNLSQQSVFIAGQRDDSVSKLFSGETMCIFSNDDFAQKIRAKHGEGYHALSELIHDCTIQLSFIKGWGGKYFRRQVNETPCWLEIRLLDPLVILTQALQTTSCTVNCSCNSQ